MLVAVAEVELGELIRMVESVPAASTPSQGVAVQLYIQHDSKLPRSGLVELGLWLRQQVVLAASTPLRACVAHLCIRLPRFAVAGLGIGMKCDVTAFVPVVPVVGRLIAAEQLCIRP